MQHNEAHLMKTASLRNVVEGNETSAHTGELAWHLFNLKQKAWTVM